MFHGVIFQQSFAGFTGDYALITGKFRDFYIYTSFCNHHVTYYSPFFHLLEEAVIQVANALAVTVVFTSEFRDR
ncbi:hypothetical protein [Endozoicomonas sp. GU-1]|uniref:hypothetical protein n=1 Tax=Endozoicomonas sp. GU-1 TaxID=3009078 RepID=UPI0022B5DD23|nr:hypothetical protein [Endozoicomonas sp. GU-1]WBA81233.1 hypothetical protein O2T12_23550 [Endozoicomonas sp. GU-1]